jgi:hypothetical protein
MIEASAMGTVTKAMPMWDVEEAAATAMPGLRIELEAAPVLPKRRRGC